MSTLPQAIALANPRPEVIPKPVGFITAVCFVVIFPNEDVIAKPTISTLDITSTEPKPEDTENPVGLIVISVNALNVDPNPTFIC